MSIGGCAASPAMPARVTGARVTLRAAPWSAVGYTAASPGFCFWFKRDGSLAHGEEMLAKGGKGGAPPVAVRCHHFAHRVCSPP